MKRTIGIIFGAALLIYEEKVRVSKKNGGPGGYPYFRLLFHV